MYKKAIKKFKKSSPCIIITTILAKLLFGVGLGFILASYLYMYDTEQIGWIIIVISLILHIPVIREIYFKK